MIYVNSYSIYYIYNYNCDMEYVDCNIILYIVRSYMVIMEMIYRLIVIWLID